MLPLGLPSRATASSLLATTVSPATLRPPLPRGVAALGVGVTSCSPEGKEWRRGALCGGELATLATGVLALSLRRRRQRLHVRRRRKIQRRVGELPSSLHGIVGKKQLKQTITWVLDNHGRDRTKQLLDDLKNLGFGWATRAGVSLGIEDLVVPGAKAELCGGTRQRTLGAEEAYENGEISVVEKFLKVTDEWTRASEDVKSEAMRHLQENDRNNSVYMMATSGARGNISQVRQLIAMRGLMADANGQLIDIPIEHCLKEGMTVTDMLISSNGARKGCIDTALRTADSGYLYRRLDFAATEMIIHAQECGTLASVAVTNKGPPGKTTPTLDHRIRGRVLAGDIVDPTDTGVVLHAKGHLLRYTEAVEVRKLYSQYEKKTGKDAPPVHVRSTLSCKLRHGVCQSCYGEDLSTPGQLVRIGHPVGTIAAQSMGEPGTQLTMRTFHTGGAFEGSAGEGIRALHGGRIRVQSIEEGAEAPARRDLDELLPPPPGKWTRHRHGAQALIMDGYASVLIEEEGGGGRILQKEQPPPGTLLRVFDGNSVTRGQILFELYKKTALDEGGGDAEESAVEKIPKPVISEEAGDVVIQRGTEPGTPADVQLEASLVWVLRGQRVRLAAATGACAVAVLPGDLVSCGSQLAAEWSMTKGTGVPRFLQTERGQPGSIVASSASDTPAGNSVRVLDWLQGGPAEPPPTDRRTSVKTQLATSAGVAQLPRDHTGELLLERMDFDQFEAATNCDVLDYSVNLASSAHSMVCKEKTSRAVEMVIKSAPFWVKDSIALAELRRQKSASPASVRAYRSYANGDSPSLGSVVIPPSSQGSGAICTVSRIAHAEHVVPFGGLIMAAATVEGECRRIFWSPERSHTVHLSGDLAESLAVKHGEEIVAGYPVLAYVLELLAPDISGHLCVYTPHSSPDLPTVTYAADSVIQRQCWDRSLCAGATAIGDKRCIVECVIKPGKVLFIPNEYFQSDLAAWFSEGQNGCAHMHQKLIPPGVPFVAGLPDLCSKNAWRVVELLDRPDKLKSCRLLIRPARQIDVPLDMPSALPSEPTGKALSTWYMPYVNGEVVDADTPVVLCYELVNSSSRCPGEPHAVSTCLLSSYPDYPVAQAAPEEVEDQDADVESVAVWADCTLGVVQHSPPKLVHCEAQSGMWLEPPPRHAALREEDQDINAHPVPRRVLPSPRAGYISNVARDKNSGDVDITLIRPDDYVRVPCRSPPTLSVGALVRRREQLSATDVAPVAGQILSVEEGSPEDGDAPFSVVLRIGRPYLVNKGRVNVTQGSSVKAGDLLAVEDLVVPKTSDIVQGLPRINKLFEACGAAQKDRLNELWEEQRKLTGDGIEASEVACGVFQSEFVSEVQSAYLEQGVPVNSKHIEIVAKKMTEKCFVIDGGGTSLQQGSLVHYRDIEALGAIDCSSRLRVRPTVRGVTKIGMDSHVIVSMGFREVDNVLTSAVSRGPATYPLRGIKENLMMGKPISVGTGHATQVAAAATAARAEEAKAGLALGFVAAPSLGAPGVSSEPTWLKDLPEWGDPAEL